MLKPLSIAALCLLAGGCSLLPYGPQAEALIDEAREKSIIDRKKYNDDKRDLIMELGCDISLGAAGRMTDKVKQFYLGQHCGLDLVSPQVRTVGPQPPVP